MSLQSDFYNAFLSSYNASTTESADISAISIGMAAALTMAIAN